MSIISTDLWRMAYVIIVTRHLQSGIEENSAAINVIERGGVRLHYNLGVSVLSARLRAKEERETLKTRGMKTTHLAKWASAHYISAKLWVALTSFISEAITGETMAGEATISSIKLKLPILMRLHKRAFREYAGNICATAKPQWKRKRKPVYIYITSARQQWILRE